jgi:hypothetical protein
VTRYDWPASDDAIENDNAMRRAGHNARVRVDFDLSQALTTIAARAATSPTTPAEPLAPPGAVELVPSGTGAVWVPVGPTTVLRGQAAGSPRIAGRVRDVWASPDGLRVYAAAAGGGVWFSGDAATTWRPLGGWATTSLSDENRAAMTLACGCLHVSFGAAASGADDLVVVGTGELTPRRHGIPGGQIGGVGVLFAKGPAAVTDPFANPWTRVAPNLEGHGIYRIVQDPDQADRYVVASSLGLFSHSGANTVDQPWLRVDQEPFNVGDEDLQVISDVVWVPRHDGEPARLYVAIFDKGVWMSEDGPFGPFDEVSLPGSVDNRLGLAYAPSDPEVVYVLGARPALWRIGMTADGPVARKVDGVPKFLFGGTDHDQSGYDLALAVNPEHSDVVLLGGSGTRNPDSEWEAALVRCTVTAQGDHFTLDFTAANDANDAGRNLTIGNDPVWIGYGVHADVHLIRYAASPAGLDVYVGCDGGVFRSRTAPADDNKRNGTFVSLNSGLAVVEPGYLASHPVNDLSMAIGTQDNGMLVRVGDSVWALKGYGDGGGVAFHPDHPDNLMWQYTSGTWYGDNNWTKPVFRRTTANNKVKSEDEESEASSFYSNPAMVRRADGGLRVVLGTNRIWLSDDWTGTGAVKNTWVTIPSKEDPRRGTHDDTSTDRQFSDSDGKVIALRWLSPRRLLVLMRRAVLIYREGVDGKWLVDTISDKGTKCGTSVSNDAITSPSDFLPPVKGAEWSDVAVHDPEHNARGSFYVATTSTRDDDNMDTLWWFDGAGKWFSTGLREQGTAAPAYAVVVDHDPAGEIGTVYVGTAVGVWKGELDDAGPPPQWAWTPLTNGLPEAAVQDLAVVHYGDRTLLRAAVQARGVWELELAATTPAPKTYLRSWTFDGRRGASSTAATDFPDPDFDPGLPTDWIRSPDVSVRPALGSVPPAPAFPMSVNNYSLGGLWAFQTALHAVDPACRPTSGWTKAFGRRLEIFRRAHDVGGSPVPANLLQVIDANVWGQVVDASHVFAPMWDGGEPTEADLLELVRMGHAGDGSTFVPAAHLNVDVLVHHRDSRPIAGTKVRVTLLQRDVSGPAKPWEAARIEADACAAVGTALTGVPPAAMPAPWSYATNASRVLSPTAGVDARTPRPVTFTFDASILGGSSILLLAVISTDDEAVALAPGLVRDLVRSDAHLAARVLRVR